MNPEFEFGAFAAAHGYVLHHVIADGRLHRFPTAEDSRGERTGWYRLWSMPPRGVLGDWRRGDWRGIWRPGADTVERPIPIADLRPQRMQEEAQRRRQRAAGAEAAVLQWNTAGNADPDHPYLVKKQIGPGWLHQRNATLLVPLLDQGGEIRSLQWIWVDAEGTTQKRFLAGTSPKGLFYIAGKAELEAGDKPLLLCEGMATAHSLFESTGLSTIAAMCAGNLTLVAISMRRRFPCRRFMVCADDDAARHDNPGLVAGAAAALGSRAMVTKPVFSRPGAGTDFNDMAALEGHAAVADAIFYALEAKS